MKTIKKLIEETRDLLFQTQIILIVLQATRLIEWTIPQLLAPCIAGLSLTVLHALTGLVALRLEKARQPPVKLSAMTTRSPSGPPP